MKSDTRSLLLLFIMAAYVMQGVEAVCSTQGCDICTFTLSTDTNTFSQSCTTCVTGYVLKNGTCNFDMGLILGLSIGAVAIIVFQIVGFYICQLYFKHKFRKPVQYTLQQIFEELEEEKYNSNRAEELHQKYREFMEPLQDPDCPEKDCRYCSYYELKYQKRDVWPKFDKYEKWMKMKEERRRKKIESNQELTQQDEQGYREINPKGPTAKIDSCKHYYHLSCLKKQVRIPLHVDKEDRDPNEKYDDAPCCICNQDLSQLVVVLICKICKAKERKLKFRLKQKNIDGLKEYVCAFCNDKIYKEVEKHKWINMLIE